MQALPKLRAARGGFLPSLSVSANAGWQRIDRPNSLSSANNNKDRFARSVGVSVSQLLFDGFSTNNKIRRQEAQSHAAALRILVTSEQLALDTVEAYVDVIRYSRVLTVAVRNKKRHAALLDKIRRQFDEGNAGLADFEQAKERHYAAAATISEVKRSAAEVKARFRNLVGKAPSKLKAPKALKARIRSADAALHEITRRNPRILAAMADVDAAKYDYESSKGGFLPKLSIEGNASFAEDINAVRGRNNEFEVKGVLSWDLYDGGKTSANSVAQGEKWTESQLRVDSLRRDLRESYERAWAAYTTVSERIAYLREEEAAARRLVSAYLSEYEIGQRSLVNVLDAENSLFNASINLENARAVFVFASYQLEAVLGNLLNRMGVDQPGGELVYERHAPSNLPKRFKVTLEPLQK